MRVVLIDDDPMLRRLLRIWMTDAGHEVLAECADGAEALSCPHVMAADVVLTDCQMPHVDGLKLTRSLRAQGFANPIVMMSGQTDPSVIDLAYSVGVSSYLAKPVLPARLHRVLTELTRPMTSAA